MVIAKKRLKNASENAKPGKGGVYPPKERQFGQPNGNPRNNGSWNKKATLRWKWERLFEMDEEELGGVINNPDSGRVEKITAKVLLSESMKPTEQIAVIEKMANRVYGMPKQEQDVNVGGEITELVVKVKDYTKRKKRETEN